MSYNISTVKSLKIKDLFLKLDSIYNPSYGNWMPEKGEIDLETGKITIQCGCEQEIIGEIIGTEFKVSELHLYGEGSGTFWCDYMTEILKTSTGEMSGTFIWEGGDSICKVVLKDGVLTEEEVEL